MTTLFDKIKEVTELGATSGFEAPVRNYLRKTITPLVDEVQTDGLGGIFGIKHSQAESAPKVLVAAHMDEVGFMISEITCIVWLTPTRYDCVSTRLVSWPSFTAMARMTVVCVTGMGSV